MAVVLAHLALLGVLLARPAAAAPAQDTPATSGSGYVSVIEVSGLLDRVLVDFVETQITKAERQGAVALVLQLNSDGAVVADDRLAELVQRIETSTVPVDVWVGPSGAQARDEAGAEGRPRRHEVRGAEGGQHLADMRSSRIGPEFGDLDAGESLRDRAHMTCLSGLTTLRSCGPAPNSSIRASRPTSSPAAWRSGAPMIAWLGCCWRAWRKRTWRGRSR